MILQAVPLYGGSRIGLTRDRYADSLIDDGDKLITYQGQRFHPDFTKNGIENAEPLLKDDTRYGAKITEFILGFDGDVHPGKYIPDIDSTVFPGYSHIGGTNELPSEAKILCSDPATCLHPSYLAVKNFFENNIVQSYYCRDYDGDGFGDSNSYCYKSIVQPTGYVENDKDCDDTNPDINPDAVEIADDGIDQNCDGKDDITPYYYRDNDGDGFGDSDDYIRATSQPVGYVKYNKDCDDTNPDINPNAVEIANDGIDQDCDGKDGSVVIPGGDFTNSLGMSFVEISAGTFTMGSPSSELGRDSGEIQHQVTLTNDYYIQTTEVTQGQWKAVMGSNPSYFQNCGDNCPVEQVSWDDIQTFITKLNGMGQGTYALPTEAQWEYAARAGTTTPFNTGSCLSTDQANFYGPYSYNGCPTGVYRWTTISVASVSPNSWGIYDMHGNVWEWCNDWYGAYATVAATDPVGPGSGSNRVVRGGGWLDNASYCRSAVRSWLYPSGRGRDNGFRLVRLAE